MAREKIRRYPGTRSFSMSEQEIFYGRKQEIKELYNLIRVKPVVVMFAKSGIGKTSLLNAGLIPSLKDILPISIRFQNTNIEPSTILLNALKEYGDKKILKKYASSRKRLSWEILKSRELIPFEESKTPLLIFDQFEEFFNHPVNARVAFRKELAHFINQRIPDEVYERFLKVARKDRTHELMAWCSPVNLKILFIIRSDHLHHMDELSKEITSILNHRFPLKPLHIEQTRKAIVEPALINDLKYETTPFEFDDPLIEDILSIKDSRDEIESWQLQILCESIEKQVLELQKEGKKNVKATQDFLGGKEGIELILNDFYKSKLAEIENETERFAAQKLIEEVLILDGRRIRADVQTLIDKYGVTKELLQKLVDKRLLRSETQGEFQTYEISHDTIVRSILRNKEKRSFAGKAIDIDWEFIAQSILENKCVIILGSQFFQDRKGKLYNSSMIALGDLFHEKFRYLEEDDLFEILDPYFHPIELEALLLDYYKKQSPPKYYNELTKLGIKTIISLAQDSLMLEVLQNHAIPYNYINNRLDPDFKHEQLPLNPSVEELFFFDLLGSVQNSESMVLTNEHVIKLLEQLNTIGFPSILEKRLREANLFLFLGLNFRKWYMKPILWQILHKSTGIRYAFNSTKDISKDLKSTYKGLFNINFYEFPPSGLIRSIKKNLQSSLKKGHKKEFDFKERIKMIHSLVAKNTLDTALSNTRVLVEKLNLTDLYRSLISQNARFSSLQNNRDKGLISFEQYRASEKQVKNALQAILNKIESAL